MNIIAVIIWVVILIVAGVIEYYLIQKGSKTKLDALEKEARDIVENSKKEAEATKKEAILEAKEEAHKLRTDLEKESRERRNEIQRLEKRVIQREEALDKKAELLEKKDDSLNKRVLEVEELEASVNDLYSKQREELERISNLSSDEAREMLLEEVKREIKHETAMMIKDIESKAKEEADKKAREIITTAIQRCAADHVSETTVHVVALPNDEMKGRIIGREGRNIRTLETLTGVDLIIDDTPEAVILSSFDPIRREVARMALEKLIVDGRIHPARIEEMVERAKKDVENDIKEEDEGPHAVIGAELAKKYNESPLVVNAIGAHHGDMEMQSIEAILVQAADAISAARPGARRETLEAYIKRLEKLEEIANSYEGVEKSFAIQAGREIRIMVKPDQVDDAGAVELVRNIVKDIEEQLEYPGQIKINVIRETRAVDYAK